MMTVETEELDDAIARLRTDNYHIERGWSYRREQDLILCGEAYLDHIMEQGQVEAERALPITEEWLMSIGLVFSPGYGTVPCCIVDNFQLMHPNTDSVWVKMNSRHQVVFADCRKRGELLDLLKALRIELKGE